MIKTRIYIIFFIVSLIEAQNNKQLIPPEHMVIKREIDPKCKMIPISNDMFWEKNYASSEVPDICKATFITSAGSNISPMRLHKDIETYGEKEVIEFIDKMRIDNSMLLIDTRSEEWYEYNTIPGAINIHYLYIMSNDSFPDEHQAALKKLGIQIKHNAYDFSEVKTILLFCNGSWCSQSPKMIKALLALGYPAHMMKWYRGGMDDWLGLSLTSTRKR